MKDAMITQPLGTKLLFDGKRVIEIKKENSSRVLILRQKKFLLCTSRIEEPQNSGNLVRKFACSLGMKENGRKQRLKYFCNYSKQKKL